MGVSGALRRPSGFVVSVILLGCIGVRVETQGPAPLPPPSAGPIGSATAVQPLAPTPKAPQPLPEGSIGAPGPLLVQRSSTNRRWIALCQARKDTDGDGEVAFRAGPRGELLGDAVGSYLVRGAGEGIALDEFVDADPSGRWLLLQRDGKLELFDDYSGESTDLSALGADPRDDVSRDLPHRAFSFDAVGKLAYLRLGVHRAGMLPGQRKEQVVVRDLETGEERVFDPERGSVYRLRLDPTGNWLILRVLIDDSNENGRFDWPLPEQGSGVSKRCVPPRATYSTYPGRGDSVHTRTLYLGSMPREKSAKLERRDRLISPLGARLIFRHSTPRLFSRSYRYGRLRTEKVDLEGCDPRVIHSDAARNSLVVACEPKPEEVEKTRNYRHAVELVRLLGSGQVQRIPLGFDLAPIRSDSWSGDAAGPRLLHFYPGSETRILDMQSGEVLPLELGDIVLHTFEAHALVRRRNALWLFDAGAAQGKQPAGAWRNLGARVDEVTDELHQGRYSWVSPQWVDLEEGRVLGEQRRVLALSDDGRALVPAGADSGAKELAEGPLVWVLPDASLPHGSTAASPKP